MKSIRLSFLMLLLALSMGFSSKVIKMGDVVNYPGSSAFAPVPSPDGEVLYFTSDRPGGLGGQDVWVSHFVNGIWTEPVVLAKPLNTLANEGADDFVYDQDNIFMYLTLCNRPDGKGMCDIYVSIYNPDGSWTEPKNIGAPINSEYSEANAFFDTRENILYFTSNRPGGLGTRGRKGEASFDIWMSKRMPDGGFSEPKNLGAPVNTEESEEKAYFDAATGWLFFSSDGHGGKGGVDIFKVKRLGGERWGDVVAVDIVNSTGNDSYFTLSEGSNYGYFSSDVGGKNQIYMVPITEIFTSQELAMRKKNYASNLPPAVPAIGEMALVFKKKFCQGIQLEGGPAVVQPDLPRVVYFELGKAELSGSASELISAWAKYLKDNPERRVEVGGHTDSLGNEDYNLLLSKKRADAVQARLTGLGVKSSQLLPAYFGAARPAEPNDPKAGNPRNRRVELKVVE
jgi:outer membrane protein OmpA-like peptidoglycan-associated protein